MGTRADFYVKRKGEPLAPQDWLGSLAFDGYPDNDELAAILKAGDGASFLAEVAKIANGRDDWTSPEQGWPWPWETSNTTDYAYVFNGEQVVFANFGECGDGVGFEFPNMKDLQNVTFGKRSGLLIVGQRPDGTIGLLHQDE